YHPEERPGVGGAEPRPVGDQLRPGLERRDRVHRSSARAGAAVSGRTLERLERHREIGEKAVAQQRRGLGRGLGALIQEPPRPADRDAARGPDSAKSAAESADSADVPVEVLGAHYREIEVSAITPNPRQPRRTFDEEALDELAESIR